MNPYVKSVKAQDDYLLLLTFDNGEKRIFDVKPYLGKGVFGRLKNPVSFSTVRVVSGSVEWSGDVDLSYDTLYIESKPVEEAQLKRKASTSRKKLATASTKKIRQTKAK